MKEKKGMIAINAYSELKNSLNQSERLKDELEKLGIKVDILRNRGFNFFIDNNDFVSKIDDYDFCIYLDKDKYISEILEKQGMRLFNSHNAICVCDDKMCTYIALAGQGIKLVKTLPGMLCYSNGCSVDIKDVEKVEKEIGYPVIIKECYGSLGKGVYKADNREELMNYMNELIFKPHIFQQFIKSSAGVDTRIIVIGGKFYSAMKRISKGDFRSNIELGGEGYKVNLTKEQIANAENVAKILNLDYCGIDMLDGENGEHIVCEVNSNAFFGGIEKVTGVNVAKKYAEYIYNEIYH